jgi:Fe-S-cluster-containing dehydrogenase component
MKKDHNQIWIGEQDLNGSKEFIENSDKELSLLENIAEGANTPAMSSNRRDFLRMLGFSVGAAAVAAGCDIPVKRAIPYVVKPDSIIPGVATYYASVFAEGGDYVPVLVKTREGRPIKIEGNKSSKVTKGGTSARAQASVLSLYDTNRLRNPMIKKGSKFVESTWDDTDKEVMEALKSARSVRYLSNTINSPTGLKAISEFGAKFGDFKHVMFDSVSYSALLDAQELSFGVRALPVFQFEKADTIVSFDADFLGTWISPTEFAKAYSKNRKLKDVENPKMSHHVQIESRMSLSGSNADNRILVKPSEQGVAMAHLYNLITGGSADTSGLNEKAKSSLGKLASKLKASQGKSLVLCGVNGVAEQLMCIAINETLGNYGETISKQDLCYHKKGNDAELAELLSDIKTGKIDVLIIKDVNPVFNHLQGNEFAEAISNIGMTIAFSSSMDETSSLCKIQAPAPHYLESWGDVQSRASEVALVQPTISPLFNTRQYEESLLIWSESENLDNNADQPYYEYVKESWKAQFFGKQDQFLSFHNFWDNSLHNGVLTINSDISLVNAGGELNTYLSQITKPSTKDVEISFYESVAIGNGEYATNPWLMEMPDPVTRTSWGNYLAVPVKFDGVRRFIGMNNLKDGDLVDLTINGNNYTVPVIQQFGQMPGTVSLALGHGRTLAGECGTGVGVNINKESKIVGGYNRYMSDEVSVSEKIGTEKHYSSVQYHHTYAVTGIDKKTGEQINADEAAQVFFDYGTGITGFQGLLTDRSVIYTTNINELKDNLKELHHRREHAQFLNSKQIYRGYDQNYEQGHHWGMHIDLNACIGCGACTVACMAENNVPVVGKKEVSRHHEMTWLRIDRYYYGDHENPNTVYHPMMCQHCDNAPCENVCPVNATNHSSEGLNQMTYNRCIGTRYCANNCPFKVRRFNWLDYTTADLFPGNSPKISEEEIPFGADNLTRMVLNPDVTVRTRGVIEKCSFCVQRIQEGKLTAKVEGRALRDGDVKTACQTSCPTGAITFGDMNLKEGKLAEKLESPLNYLALEEVNVRSSVNYTMKVNNRDQSLDA